MSLVCSVEKQQLPYNPPSVRTDPLKIIPAMGISELSWSKSGKWIACHCRSSFHYSACSPFYTLRALVMESHRRGSIADAIMEQKPTRQRSGSTPSFPPLPLCKPRPLRRLNQRTRLCTSGHIYILSSFTTRRFDQSAGNRSALPRPRIPTRRHHSSSTSPAKRADRKERRQEKCCLLRREKVHSESGQNRVQRLRARQKKKPGRARKKFQPKGSLFQFLRVSGSHSSFRSPFPFVPSVSSEC